MPKSLWKSVSLFSRAAAENLFFIACLNHWATQLPPIGIRLMKNFRSGGRAATGASHSLPPSHLFLSRFKFELLTLNFSFFTTSLCFHTLTHSFASPRNLSSIFSGLSALFAQNTRGGLPRISKRSICLPPCQARNCHELSSRNYRTLDSLLASHHNRSSMPSALRRPAVWTLQPSPRPSETKGSR